MIGRVQYLEKMGLATPAGPGEWMVVLEAERSLRDLGMRGDIIKTMHRVFTERGQDRGVTNYVIDAGASGAPIIGRLVDKIGRASCRERGSQYVSISVVAVPLKK